MAKSGTSSPLCPRPMPPGRSDMILLQDYAGREQSYVKHVFLERYLDALIHKTASTYPHVVYVDGFAGPWQSANEALEDTSFGVALNALRQAKKSWNKKGREVLHVSAPRGIRCHCL
jgi:three-Cys-motif partner protein